jgi:hypothetical protein
MYSYDATLTRDPAPPPKSNPSRDRPKLRKNAPASGRWQAEACSTIADKQPAALWDRRFRLSTDFFSASQGAISQLASVKLSVMFV